jgi:hypothetical protein
VLTQQRTPNITAAVFADGITLSTAEYEKVYAACQNSTRATTHPAHHSHTHTCPRRGAGLGQVRGEGSLALPAEVDVLKHALQLRRVVRVALLYRIRVTASQRVKSG